MARNKFAYSVVTKSVGVAIGATCVGWANMASAVPPANVSGVWNIIGNQSAGVLRITQGVSAWACKPISGTIYGNQNVVGYYCPSTGRLAFTRQILGVTAAQMWVGNVSDFVQGQPQRLGGTFHAVNAGAGSGVLGEYHFQGQK